MILTHCGKLGDLLLCLPIASWVHNVTGERVRWVLSDALPQMREARILLLLQDSTESVDYVPFPVRHYKCGAQPYHFDPSQYGFTGEYRNLGFRYLPDKPVAEFIAEEYGLGVDRDFVLKVMPWRQEDTVYLNDYGRLTNYAQPHWHELSTETPFFINVGLAMGAREVHGGYSAFAHAVNLAGHPNLHVWKHSRTPNERWYFHNPGAVHFYHLSPKPEIKCYC